MNEPTTKTMEPTDPATVVVDATTPHTTRAAQPWWLAAFAGVLAAGAALGVAELLAGLSARIPSLLVSVGNWVVDNGFEELDNWSRDTFGTDQKSVLIFGITVTCLALGFVTGIAARGRNWVAVAVFGAFGFLGGAAAATDDLTHAGWSWFAGIVAAAVGAATLIVLLDRLAADRPTGASTSAFADLASRRTFLTASGVTALVAIVGGGLGRRLRLNRNVEGARSEVAAALGSESAAAPVDGALDTVNGISTFYTPNDSFYRIDTALQPPLINPDDWTLDITGMVDNPFSMGFDELLELATVEETVTLSCVSNEVGGNLVGNAHWQGVRLGDLLERAGVQDGADQIVGKSVDGWTAGFPTETAFDGRTALVAVAMNGEPLPVRHGFPARLVVAGLYGYVSATKWLESIELTTWDSFDGYWIPRGWAKEGPMKTQSRIDVPGGRIPAGLTAVAGVAWAPTRGISRVEVQIDDDDWVEARLGDDLTEAWRQWVYEWDATPGDHRIRVRATDGSGDTQTDEEAPPRPDGASGWHSRNVTVEDSSG